MHRRTRSRLAALASVLLVPQPALAADWTLTTSDFESRPVDLRALDDRTVTVTVAGDGEASTVPLARVLQVTRDEAGAARSAGPFVLALAGGDRLAGSPVATDGADVAWRSPTLGEVRVPFVAIRSMRRRDAPPASADAGPQDVVRFANGDVTSGLLTGLSAEGATLSDGSALPLAAIAAVDLAAVPGGGDAADPDAGRPTFRVSLDDGTAVTATGLTLAEETLTFAPSLGGAPATGGKPVTVPLAAVRSIEQVGGPVRWLSSLDPTAAERVPYFPENDAGDATAPAFARDRAVGGGPIVADGRSYARGLGVRSRSRLTFAVPPDATSFRTRYAVADGLPYADVTVRVLADGRPVHEQTGVRSGALADPVTVPLDGVAAITLEVDYGENYDVQDRLNWIEPAFVRSE